MSNLMIFENKQVEVFEWNGQVLFNPKHVAECLEIADVNSSIRNFNEKQVIKLTNSNMHNMQFRKLHNTGENFLTESGVYKLIFKSKKEEAEKFQDWVTDEVLPSIRKTGSYQTQENKPTCIEDVLISSLQEMKALKGEVQAVKVGIEEAKEELQGIRDVITLEPNQWRKDTANLINKIANKLGGFEHIKPIREEAYKLLDNSYSVSLKTRLLNKQKKMALEGVPKYKIDKVNYLDVIADDKKLINGYIYIVGKLAVKHGIS